MNLKKLNGLSALGLLATLLGGAATLLGQYADERRQDRLIQEKIDEAMAERFGEEEDEEEEES